MKLKNIYTFLATILLLTGCAAEAPFPSDRVNPGDMGEFHKSSINLDIISGEGIHIVTRAGEEDLNLNEFQIDFLEDGKVKKSFDYGAMPNVVMLDPGVYQIKATYGEDKDALFNNPYFIGESGEFIVESNKITSNIDPIKCTLRNVKVTIKFEESLIAAFGEDGTIVVKLGNSGPGLTFTKEDIEKGTPGYFKIGSENTLVAVFHGKVFGTEITETKSLSEISAGTHYEMTFKLHDHTGSNSGTTTSSVNIDASVNYENISNDVTVEDVDMKHEDTERPKQDDQTEDPGKEDPVDPGKEDPENPTVDSKLEITAKAPIDLDVRNDVVEGMECVLYVKHNSEIKEFEVEIDSETLTLDVLSGVGLSTKFELISGKTAEGADVMEGLAGLGLPVGDSINVRTEDGEGWEDVVFDISGFMQLLGIYGAANHNFILTVTDANNKTVSKTLKLKTL